MKQTYWLTRDEKISDECNLILLWSEEPKLYDVTGKYYPDRRYQCLKFRASELNVKLDYGDRLEIQSALIELIELDAIVAISLLPPKPKLKPGWYLTWRSVQHEDLCSKIARYCDGQVWKETGKDKEGEPFERFGYDPHELTFLEPLKN